MMVMMTTLSVRQKSNSCLVSVLLTIISDEARIKCQRRPSCYHPYLHVGIVKQLFCGSEHLGGIWAAIQTELLTYRRITKRDPWISSRFSLDRLFMGLEDGVGATRLALYEKSMMKRFSLCGWFLVAEDPLCPIAEEVSEEYMMNMEDWDRTELIPSNKERWDKWRYHWRKQEFFNSVVLLV